MEKRYERNCNMLTASENEQLAGFKVCVVGCGGLGGFILEMLARIGIGKITAIDGDTFDVSNLNRQLLSRENNIGKSKALIAKEHLAEVNSTVEVTAITAFLDQDNGKRLVKGHDVVIDALDNMQSRKILETACSGEGIPMIHGAIAGWYGQVAVILPEKNLLSKIYPDNMEKGAETDLGNPSFTPAAVASIQVSECIKLLLKRDGLLADKMLTIDLLTHEYDILQF